MRKAITPVVAIVLLLMMTVAAAGLAYTFITSTQQETQEAVSGDIRTKTQMMSTCVSVDYAYENKAVIRNCGSGIVSKDSLVMIMDGAVLNFTMSPSSINNGETATLNLSGLWAISPGVHTLKAKSGMGQVASLEVIAEPRKDGLVGSWGFDEGSGTTAYDGSGNGNSGTIIDNEGDQWTAGKFGKGLQFDGANDYVNMTNENNFDVSQFTVSAWIKINSTAAVSKFIASKYNDGGGGNAEFRFTMDDSNKLQIFVSDPTLLTYMYKTTNIVLSTNKWYHVVGTYSGITESASLKLYVNGTEITDVTAINPSFWGLGDTVVPFRVGAGSTGNTINSFFNGTIDEVRIWSRALAPDDTVNLKPA